MAKHRIIEFDTLMLESDVHALIEKQTEVMEHIKLAVPDEVLFQANGEPNIRSHWGAIYFHASMARATLRAFIT